MGAWLKGDGRGSIRTSGAFALSTNEACVKDYRLRVASEASKKGTSGGGGLAPLLRGAHSGVSEVLYLLSLGCPGKQPEQERCSDNGTEGRGRQDSHFRGVHEVLLEGQSRNEQRHREANPR